MIEKILEVVFWSLKLLSAALDLFSAVKKSRHAKTKPLSGINLLQFVRKQPSIGSASLQLY